MPIRNDAQRKLLNKLRTFVRGGSLIPPDRNYVQQLHCYERQLRNAGMTKLHGLRHAYAQRRYEELTGWKAPAAGGPAAKSLTTDQRALDREARAVITSELGHNRASITRVYLGK